MFINKKVNNFKVRLHNCFSQLPIHALEEDYDFETPFSLTEPHMVFVNLRPYRVLDSNLNS